MIRFPSINFKTFSVKKLILPFCNGNFQYVDIKQGDAGSCWFLSAIASFLRPGYNLSERQNYLQNKIKKISKDIYCVNIGSSNFIIDDYIVDYYDTNNYSYLWTFLFEKAMFSYMSKNWIKWDNLPNTFICKNILFLNGENNRGSVGFELITGIRSNSILLHTIDSQPIISKNDLLEKWKFGYFLSANTNKKTFEKNSKNIRFFNLEKNHCYAILNIVELNNDIIITLYNPHGYCNTTSQVTSKWGQFDLTWNEFIKFFNCIHYTS
jgi:hypothetical protein